MSAKVKHFTPDDFQEPWSEPLPLASVAVGANYPLHALPLLLRDAVLETKQFIQAPTALAACCALSALSLSAQGLADVRRASGLIGPISLYLLTAAPSGERKSAVDAVLMQAIKQYEREQAEASQPAMTKHRSEHDAWEAKRRGILDAIKLQAKNGNDTTETRVSLATHDTLEPKPPLVPKLLMQDITSAALVHSLGSRWPSSGMVSAEAGAVLGGHSMSADELMRTLSLQNSIWSGETIDVSRRASESFTVRGARMTIGIALQPDTLREFMQRSGDLARGTGWLARMLVAIPASTQGYRKFIEPPAHWSLVSRFNHRLLELLRLPMPLVGDECELNLPVLDFDADAKACWIKIHDAFEESLRKGGEFAEMRDTASKAAENVARIAALFHILEHGPTGLIDANNVDHAGVLVAWHLNEAARMTSGMSITPQALAAQDLDDWLLMRCGLTGKSSVSNREALQYGPSRLRAGHALEAALTVLIEARRVRLVELGRRRLIQINPELLEVGHVAI
jgi:putative DNA primase/helicase